MGTSNADDLLREAARRFGSAGGKARKKALSREERSAIARKAVQERWRRWREAQQRNAKKRGRP
jgi:hypothetical protein